MPVQPVALRYGPRGSAQTVVAFGAGENFFANFLRLLGEPPRSADICFLAPIAPGDAARAAADRRTGARAHRRGDGVGSVNGFGSNAPNNASMLAPMLTADDYHPPRWLRNPHVQSVLSSSGLRRRRGLRALNATGAVTTEHIVDGGDGVRLQGWHSAVPGKTSSGLALLLHGWEGSAESSYMRLTAAHLLEARLRSVPAQLPRPRRHPSSQRGPVPLQPDG